MLLTAAAIQCLALNIYHEARNQPLDGQIAVAMVTINRVIDDRYEDTVCGVVWEDKQFSWTHDGKSDNPKEVDKFKEIVNLVKNLDYNKYYSEYNGVTHYHANYVSPCWSHDYELVKIVGDHLFYRTTNGASCYKKKSSNVIKLAKSYVQD